MKYIIAIDLDGTLLNDNAKLSTTTIDYVKSLDKKKYKVILSTGRPYQAMIQYYNQLGLDTLAICSSGTSIVSPNDPTFKSIEFPLDKEMFLNFFKLTKHLVDTAIYNAVGKCFIYNNKADSALLKHMEKNTSIIEGPFDETYISSPNGLLVIIKDNKEDEFRNIVEGFAVLSCRDWKDFYGYHLFEVYQKRHNKATSLESVLKLYNAKKENLICIGDSVNDYEMLELANISVAMTNGREAIKKCAKYVTKYDNNNDGVIRFLDDFLNTKNGLN